MYQSPITLRSEITQLVCIGGKLVCVILSKDGNVSVATVTHFEAFHQAVMECGIDVMGIIDGKYKNVGMLPYNCTDLIKLLKSKTKKDQTPALTTALCMLRGARAQLRDELIKNYGREAFNKQFPIAHR